MSTRKGGLGRGLGSLIPSGESKQLSSVVAGVPVDIANLNHIPIRSIAPNPRQPRTVFDEEKMSELITSIKEVEPKFLSSFARRQMINCCAKRY